MMGRWRETTLGELLRIKHGFAFKGMFFSDSGDAILLTPGNFRAKGGLKLKGDKEKFYSGPIPEEFILRRGDMLVAMTDLTQNAPILGSAAVVTESGRFLHNQRLGKIVDLNTRAALPEYVYYLFNSEAVRAQIRATATGATVKHTAPERIYRVRVGLPPLPEQKWIAGILAAYDDLVENCEHRIDVLDDMARALYREWFVLFRYPGHEKVPLVASPLGRIPKGWNATTLNGLVELDTGKRPKGGAVGAEDAVPSVGAENVNGIGRHDYAAEKYVPRVFFDEMRRGVVRDRDVALYKDGAYIGRSTYFRDGFPHSEFAVNEHVFLLRAVDPRLGPNTLYLWLQQPETVQAIRSKNANAAQPGISRGIVNGLPIAVPAERVATQFEALIEPFLAMIIALAKRGENLRRTRDLLLPHLLNGQLSVDEAA